MAEKHFQIWADNSQKKHSFLLYFQGGRIRGLGKTGQGPLGTGGNIWIFYARSKKEEASSRVEPWWVPMMIPLQ